MSISNSALIPVPKLENDFYDWYERHQAVLDLQHQIDPEIVMIGDSITHLWGGQPTTAGRPGVAPEVWSAAFGDKRVLNMGFGWDRTQNVLWRLGNGQLDGLKPANIVLLIGTNNLTGTGNARENSAEEIAEGILAVHSKIQTKSPDSQITVMGVLPRGYEPETDFRRNITRINSLVEPALQDKANTRFLNIGAQFLQPDGTLPQELAPDGVHLSDAGYGIWGRALREHWV